MIIKLRLYHEMHIDVSSSFNCFRKKSLPQHEKGQYVFVQYDVYTAWTRVHIPRGHVYIYRVDTCTYTAWTRVHIPRGHVYAHVSSRVTVQKPWST